MISGKAFKEKTEGPGEEVMLRCSDEHIRVSMQTHFLSHLCVKMGLSKQGMSLARKKAGEGKQTGQS